MIVLTRHRDPIAHLSIADPSGRVLRDPAGELPRVTRAPGEPLEAAVHRALASMGVTPDRVERTWHRLTSANEGGELVRGEESLFSATTGARPAPEGLHWA
uniref:hypothetical protein n=1 Tax=Herbidospora sakaeratensis TaxID=564415 RepID=UPI00078491B0|nr:hypothetical protein [Herbidospora sakaeratensis]